MKTTLKPRGLTPDRLAALQAWRTKFALPSGLVTSLDIITLNNTDREVGLIEEVLTAVPELSLFPARTIKGINYRTMIRKTLPTIGFRGLNEGAPLTKSEFVNRLVECFPLEAPWTADCMAADSYEDGAAAFLGMEAFGMTLAAFIRMAKSIYYGNATTTTVGQDVKGYPGLIDSVDSSLVIDAGGSTADTGSSVWAVRFGNADATLVYGNDGQVRVTDPVVLPVTDDSGNTFDAYRQVLKARPGLQVGSINSVGRIKKLTEDSGKGLNDALLIRLFNKFPIGFKPQAYLMSRRSLGQLQASRTATNSTGAPAPMPTDCNGVPIVATDAILDTEPLTL